MARYLSVLLLAVGLLVATEGRSLGKCDIVHELIRQGFDRNQLRDWVCLIQGESSGNTAAIGRLNRDGSTDYGLFQINSRYWCGEHGPGGGCHVRCSALITDDISAAARCAQQIYRESGFSAWVAWKNKCRGKELPDISDCFGASLPTHSHGVSFGQSGW